MKASSSPVPAAGFMVCTIGDSGRGNLQQPDSCSEAAEPGLRSSGSVRFGKTQLPARVWTAQQKSLGGLHAAQLSASWLLGCSALALLVSRVFYLPIPDEERSVVFLLARTLKYCLQLNTEKTRQILLLLLNIAQIFFLEKSSQITQGGGLKLEIFWWCS